MFEKMIKTQTAKQAQMLDSWMEKHSKANPFPEDVKLTENIDYFGDGSTAHRMDIYRPYENTDRLPVLINIHGGGFLLGKKEVNRLFCADMSKRGFVVFCLEYPLVPDVDIFEVFRDLTAGINKVAEITAEYGADPSKLYLCGDSAGAYLCVYLAAMQNNSKMAEAAGVRPITPKIRSLGLQSGMFYTRKFDQIGIFLPNMIYGKGWKKKAFRPYIDPENSELVRNLPPCFLVTGNGDFLQHYSRRFAIALKKNCVEYQLLDMSAEKKLPHAFAAMLPETPEAEQANREMAVFLKAHGE